MPGVVRVPVAGPAPEGIGIASSGGYGFTEAVLAQNDGHHRVFGVLAASLRATRWLSIGGRLDGRYDVHTDASGQKDDGFVGDPRLFLRAGWSIDDGWRLGAQLGLWMPGRNAPSMDLNASSLDMLALATYGGESSPVTLATHAGFRLDNSGKSAPDAAVISRADRLALGVSDFNAVLLGIGAVTRLGARTELLTEGTWDLLVGKGAPSVFASPLRIAGGARFALNAEKSTRLQLMLDVSPGSRPSMESGQPLVPVEPRAAVMLSFTARLGMPRAPAPLHESLKQAEAPVKAPPPRLATLRGRVVDEQRKSLPGAKVTVTTTTGEKRETIADDDGTFAMPDLTPGEIDLEIKADAHLPSRVHMVLGASQMDPVETPLSRALPQGQIRGNVRDPRGRPVAARIRIDPLGTELPCDSHGNFRVDVAPGDYQVVVRAPGFVEQHRKILVDKDGVVLLNVDLRGGR